MGKVFCESIIGELWAGVPDSTGAIVSRLKVGRLCVLIYQLFISLLSHQPHHSLPIFDGETMAPI